MATATASWATVAPLTLEPSRGEDARTDTLDRRRELAEALRVEEARLAPGPKPQHPGTSTPGRTQAALEEVAKLDGVGEPTTPEMSGSPAGEPLHTTTSTIADARDAGLKKLGGEAGANDHVRLLLETSRLVKRPGDSGQAYGQMAGALPKRFARVGRARWRRVDEAHGDPSA